MKLQRHLFTVNVESVLSDVKHFYGGLCGRCFGYKQEILQYINTCCDVSLLHLYKPMSLNQCVSNCPEI